VLGSAGLAFPGPAVTDEGPEPGEHASQDVVAARAGRDVRIAGRAGGGDREPGCGLHHGCRPPRIGGPADGQRRRSRHAGQQRDSLLRAERELGEPVLGQRPGGGPGLVSGPEHLPDPGQRPEGVRQRDDLARAARAGARHRRDDALVQEVRQPLAERAGHRGVPGKERAQPDREECPHVGGGQPGRPAACPGQQQVALVHELLRAGKAHAGQRAHAGGDSVHGLPAAQHGPALLAPLLHLAEQGRGKPHRRAGLPAGRAAAGRLPRRRGGGSLSAAIGDLADQRRVQVGGGSDGQRHRRYR
jgi:hypothetical protein